MNNKIIFFISVLTIIHLKVSGNSGIAPEATLSLRLNPAYSLTFKMESFHILQFEDQLWNHEVDGVDLQFFTNFRLNPFVRFALGYLYEIEPDGNSHRTIQQASILQRIGAVSLSHRVRSEQTYSDNPIKYRFRYRTSIEVPLNGESLDPRELYMTSSAEVLYAMQDNEREVETRTVLQLGYMFNSTYRIQTGFDFRYFFYPHNEPFNLWFKVGYFINL